MRKFLLVLLTCLAPLVVSAADNDDLQNAADDGDAAQVASLLEKGANVDFQDDKYKETALMHASVSGHPDVVKVLLQHNAKLDIVNYEGHTALYWATWGDHPDVMKMLLSAGANPNIPDNRGETPLNRAVLLETRIDATDLVKLLLQRGADVNRKNKAGETVLMQAQQRGAIDTIKFLEDHGALKKPVLLKKPDDSPDAADPAHAWALAATALYAQINGLSHQILGFEPESTPGHKNYWKNSILAQNWHVSSREDLDKELQRLSNEGDRVQLRKSIGWIPPLQAGGDSTAEPSKFLAYDLCRYLLRVRAGYAAGYLTDAEAWSLMMPVAARLQHAFKSWDEMGADFLAGQDLNKGNNVANYQMVYKLLTNHRDSNSPWTINAWDTPLEKPADN
jgi:hypothetical protein